MSEKAIVINWKWADITAAAQVEVWQEEGSEELAAYCCNYRREEVFFEEELEEQYTLDNERLQELLAPAMQADELLLFLHKNPPHHYGSFDVEWWSTKVAQVVLFGGGEDPVYAAAGAAGLLDQVGGFAPSVIANETQKLLKQGSLHRLWQYYSGSGAELRELSLRFSRAVLPYLLPVNEEEIPEALQQQALQLLQQLKNAGLSEKLWPLLEQIASGQKEVDRRGFSQSFEALIYAS